MRAREQTAAVAGQRVPVRIVPDSAFDDTCDGRKTHGPMAEPLLTSGNRTTDAGTVMRMCLMHDRMPNIIAPALFGPSAPTPTELAALQPRERHLPPNEMEGVERRRGSKAR